MRHKTAPPRVPTRDGAHGDSMTLLLSHEGAFTSSAQQIFQYRKATAMVAPSSRASRVASLAVAVATCSADVEQQFSDGLISLPMGMENGAPLEGKTENLQHFFERGIRYITLAHSKSNHISDSSYDDNEHWQGLSPFGQTLIGEMNRLGVMIDVSHISQTIPKRNQLCVCQWLATCFSG